MVNWLISLDLQLVGYFKSLRTVPWDVFFLAVTNLGQWFWISMFVFLAAAILFRLRQADLIPVLAVAVLGSGAMTVAVKYLVHRSRPPADFALYTESLPSFPSAHAALSLAFFGLAAYFIYRLSKKKIIRLSAVLIAAAIVCLVGFSRLYLGVHYLSDVLGGYLIGLLWFLVGWYLARPLFRD